MPKEELRERAGIRYLTYRTMQGNGIMHGFTMRHGGVSLPPYDSLNLGAHVGDRPEAVLQNRKSLADALGYLPEHVVAGQQVHGTAVRRVSVEDRGRGSLQAEDALADTDGLLCTEPDVVLMAHSADCSLLFFYEPDRRCVGLAHAGWRGAVAGMAPAMVEAMVGLGCVREKIRVALSPSVGPCCYQVGENVAREVAGHLREHVLTEHGDRLHLDLAGLHVGLLQEAGIGRDNITRSDYCTNCRPDLFFSYRASGGATGRMAGIIALIPFG